MQPLSISHTAERSPGVGVKAERYALQRNSNRAASHRVHLRAAFASISPPHSAPAHLSSEHARRTRANLENPRS